MEKEQIIKLIVPLLLPGNGRIIMQAIPKQEMKTKSGLIIPVNTEIWTNERKTDRERREEVNPYKNYYFFAVGWAPEVPEQFRLSDGKSVEFADMIKLSERFEPILHFEGMNVYFLIHWQDCLGVIRQKKLTDMKFEVSEPEY